jgi:hypothetical protein
MYESSSKKKMTKKSWLAVGVLGVVAVGGIAAVVLGKREPASLRWYGYQIQVESRGLDEASAGGKPLRWSVSLDNRLLASDVAESHPLAVEAAKSAIEQIAEALNTPVAVEPSPELHAGEHA